MRHFSVYGKTWKVVSAKMAENGIKNKIKFGIEFYRFWIDFGTLWRPSWNQKSIKNGINKLYKNECQKSHANICEGAVGMGGGGPIKL